MTAQAQVTEGVRDLAPVKRVTVESLRQYGVEAFLRAGLPEDGARIVTDVQLEASLRGQPTHNMGNVPGYAARAARKLLNPTPNIRTVRDTMVHATVDGDNGPGQWVSVVAMRLAIAKAKQTGIGVVTAGHSNHFGAAGHYAWLAATEGLIGISTTNTGPCLAPWGGRTPTFGNNPLGVGFPSGKYYPFLLDIAMSAVAMGKIGLAIAEGRPLPLGWFLDGDGQPSTDPAIFRKYALGVPIHEHKGYGLSMALEVLAGVLTNADFPWQHREDRAAHAEYEPNLGHFFLAINPELFLPRAEFLERVDAMVEAAKRSELMEGVTEVLVPGEPEMRAREQNLREGVPLLPSVYRSLVDYAEKAGLETKLVEV